MQWALGAAFSLAFGLAALALKAVDKRGMAAGVCVGTAAYAGFGFSGFALLILFVALGSLRWKRGKKRVRRSARHALANGAVGALLGLTTAALPTPPSALTAAFAGSFAAAAADTVSGEVGQAWGGRPVLISTFRPVEKGENGGVTWIGFIAGASAAGVMGLTAAALGMNVSFEAVLAGGAAGNIADSLLGATLERRGLIGNSAVNFACAGVGAAVSALLSMSTPAEPLAFACAC